MTVRLTICGGALKGIVMEMKSSRFLIGREKDCVLRAGSPTVSRHHCVLLQDPSGLRIRDLDSTNGTFLNGRRITGEIQVRHGDMISVGELSLQVDLSAKVPHQSNETPAETIMYSKDETVSFPSQNIKNLNETQPLSREKDSPV